MIAFAAFVMELAIAIAVFGGSICLASLAILLLITIDNATADRGYWESKGIFEPSRDPKKKR